MIRQLREILRYREAVRHLVARDLKVRYSHSVLGVLWGLFSPLLMTLVYSLVFTLFVPGGIERYPVFILAGLLPWHFFSNTLISTTGTISGNGHLINRVYFPREVLPVANILSNAVNFLIAMLLLFAFILAFQVRLSATVLWLPILVVVQLMLIAGIGLFLAAVNVFFRDTQQIIDIVMLAWFFLTPVLYPIDLIADASLRLLVQALNPMASLVVAYRHILYYGTTPDPAMLALTASQALLVLLVGSLVFRRLSPAFAEEV